MINYSPIFTCDLIHSSFIGLPVLGYSTSPLSSLLFLLWEFRLGMISSRTLRVPVVPLYNDSCPYLTSATNVVIPGDSHISSAVHHYTSRFAFLSSFLGSCNVDSHPITRHLFFVLFWHLFFNSFCRLPN